MFGMASVLRKSPVAATNYRAKSGCGGLFQQLFQILPREAFRAGGDLLRRAAGDELAAAGAETFRIEETMRRVLAAYGIECETFAIPNCVMVSLEADNGKPLMIMKRVGFHGNDLESVEKLNALARRILSLIHI